MDSNYKKIICNLDKRKLKPLALKLNRTKPNKLDDLIHNLHNEVFELIDCLKCANCCKTISPIIKDKDIQRISKHLKIKPSDFTEKYLRIDEDKDYVYKSQPCPFLLESNECLIYESRPKACAEYPHTDRKNFYQIIDLTVKNAKVCPAVSLILQRFK